MASSIELATGYVTIASSTQKLAKELGSMFAGVEKDASSTGKKMGAAMAKSFDAAKPDVDSLAAEVERAEKRVASQADVSARKVEAAKRKTEIAQAKLNETTSKYGPKSSQALSAVDRLATAEQKLEAETKGAADAQNRLQNELKQSKDALSTASKASSTASTTYARGWKGVGQKLKAELSRGMKTATTAANKQAEDGGKRAGGGFSNAFKGALAGVAAGFSIGAVVGGVKEVVGLAGDAEQSIGAIDTVFKENAQTMHDWAATASQTVGISGNEYRELGTLLGSQLKNMGTPMDQIADKTNGLIGMGADMASMFGGTTKEAIEAISSALKGEMDPIEKYGVTLSAAALDAEALAKGIIKPVKDADKIASATTKLELAQNKYNEAIKKNGKDSDEAKRAKLNLTSAEEALNKATAGKIPKLDAESKALAIQSALYGQSADAQGNFARESDTLQNKQQKAAASFQDLKETIGTAFLPAMTSAFGFLNEKAIPALVSFGDWIQQNQAWLKPLAVTLLSVGGAFFALKGAISIIFGVTNAVAALKGGFAALNIVMKANIFGLIIAAIVGLVAGFMYLWKTNEDFRNFFINLWKNISGFFVGVWNNVLKPAFKAVGDFWKNTVAPILSNAWNNVIKPVFSALGTFFSWVWNSVLKPAFNAVMNFWQNTLAPALSYVWNSIIKPVFNALGTFFSWVWNSLLKPAFGALKIGWEVLSSSIKHVWNTYIKPVFQALGDFIENNVKPAFQRGVDGIKKVWDTIKSIAYKPIDFVVNTVYNNGLRSMVNTMSDKLGLDWKLPEVNIPAFAKGGHMKNGWKLVGEEGPELINTGPGYVYTANETQKMLSGGMQAPMAALPAMNGGHDEKKSQMPIGGFWSDLWGGVKNTVGKVKDWAVGMLAAGVRAVTAPLKDSMSSLIPGGGFNELIRGAGFKVIDGLTGWATKKDESAGGGSGSDSAMFFDGPLGSFAKPAAGPITSGFGTSRGAYPHAGIDFAVSIGSAVRAMLNGVVRKIGWNAVTGRTGKGMVVDHADGFSSYYGHLSGWGKKPGDKVKAGERIANSGNTGRSTGPHLHAELWKNGSPFNYMSYLHDDGGWLQPGVSTIVNKTRKPEAILNPNQWDTVTKAVNNTVEGGFRESDIDRLIEAIRERESQTVSVQVDSKEIAKANIKGRKELRLK